MTEIHFKFNPRQIEELKTAGIEQAMLDDDTVAMYFKEMMPNPLLGHSQLVGLFQRMEMYGYLVEVFETLGEDYNRDTLKTHLLMLQQQKPNASQIAKTYKGQTNESIQIEFSDEDIFVREIESNGNLEQLRFCLSGLDVDSMITPYAVFKNIDTEEQTKMVFPSPKMMIGYLIRELDQFGGTASEFQSKFELESEYSVEQLLKSNWRLPIKYAKNYAGTDNLIDFIQEGNLGIAKAINKYDYRRGILFSTYATNWIWQTIFRSHQNWQSDVKFGFDLREKLRKVYKVKQQLLDLGYTHPSPRGVVELYNNEYSDPIDEVQLSEIERAYEISNAVRLDAPVGEDDADVYQFVGGENLEDQMKYRFVLDDLVRLTIQIFTGDDPGKQKRLALMQNELGIPPFDVGKKKTLEQMGQELGISRERARQLRELAFTTLKDEYIRIYGDPRFSLY